MSNERVYVIEGVDCAVCAARIEKAVNTIEGVGSSQIDLLHNRLRIHTTQHNTELDTQIAQVVAKEEHGTRVYTDAQENANNSVEASFFKTYSIPIRITFAILFTIIASRLSSGYPVLLLFVLAYAISGYEIVWKAFRNLFRGNMFDENFLMTLATIGAFIIGEYAEAVAVMAFYQVGEFFQDLAVNRSRRSIAALMDIKPVSATVLKNNEMMSVKPQDILVGDTILIRAGEKIPVDCQVMSGNAQIDVSALTGESLPRDVQVGDRLLSGSVNIDGLLHAEATSLYRDSTVATILQLVEESSQKKAQTERFITKFAKYYTPIVVFFALFLAFIPPLIGMGELSTWVYRALVFLVISCPCALVISVPIGFFGGIGGLAKMGILVKGGNYIQALAKTKYVVFDKTGTMTKGIFSVTAVHNLMQESYSSHEIIALAAAVEINSNHPIAKAIVAHYPSDSLYPVTEVQEISGKGMRGFVGGKKVEVGTHAFLESLQYDVPLNKKDTIGPSVFVAIDEQVVAQILLADTIKEESHAAIRSLKSMGITDIAMLSGDTHAHVEKTANAIGITTFFGELLPQQKIIKVEAMMAKKNPKDTLLFVGDGINDAPVLARSDIGVSMGSMGSDAAVEASDMVIMGDNLLRIPQGIAHAKKTVTIVTENIIFALGIKAIVMALGAFGIASMWLAVFADTGVALLAVLNSLRALKHD